MNSIGGRRGSRTETFLEQSRAGFMCCLRSFLHFYSPAQRKGDKSACLQQWKALRKRLKAPAGHSGLRLSLAFSSLFTIEAAVRTPNNRHSSFHSRPSANAPRSKTQRQQFVWTDVNAFRISNGTFPRDCVPKITPSFRVKVKRRSDSSRWMHVQKKGAGVPALARIFPD